MNPGIGCSVKSILFFWNCHKKHPTVWVAWMIEMYCLMITEAGSIESFLQLYYIKGFKVSATLVSFEVSLLGSKVAVFSLGQRLVFPLCISVSLISSSYQDTGHIVF